jgi:hypothetical protein
MGSGNHHIYHSDDGRCITCGLDKRTGANVLCITAVEDDRSTVAGEESSNYSPGGGVSRPSPSSPVVGEGFEDTPTFEDDFEPIDTNYPEEWDDWYRDKESDL